MSPKRNERVAPPPADGQWEIRYSTNQAAKGWDELCKQAAGNTNAAWHTMRSNPGPGPGKPTSRHHPLKGELSEGSHGGRKLPAWQIEVSGGGRVWYLLDEANHTVWLHLATTGHPKQTD